MQDGLKRSSMERRIQEGAATVESIRKLQTIYEDVRAYYRLMFKVVAEHSDHIAREISDLFGLFQGQDVVRQRLERVAFTAARRNDVLRQLPPRLAGASADLSALPLQMLEVLNEFLDSEERHAVIPAGEEAGLPKLELF